MKWSRTQIAVNDININYYRFGVDSVPQAGVPVVLAHGITDSGQCWGQTASLLVENYDILSVDARGHGSSDKPEEGYGPREHAGDLAGLITGLELEHPVIIGHSMGADVSAMLAHTKPDLPRCIILEDPPWHTAAEQQTPEETEVRAKEWREEIRGYQSHSFAEMIGIARDIRSHWPESEHPPWADAKLQMDLRAMDFITSRIPWTEMIPSIQCPVLLITADPARGAIVTPELADKICGMNSNFQAIRIDGAGHNIRREQFDKYANVVTEFLRAFS